MRIASWNINSVRLRLPLVKQLLAHTNIDILCLQETKTPDEFFPLNDLKEMGFPHIFFSGEKGYNGVAICSRIPLQNFNTMNVCGTGHKRHIQASLPDGTELHNFYIPAGGDIPDPATNPKFAHKLHYVDAAAKWSAQRDHKHPAIIVGDFNIAPQEHDVWSHKQMLKIVSHTPVEIEKLNAWLAAGKWIDTHRHFVPETEKLYSWWSYRAQDWEKSDRGRRLDHIWISPTLKPRLKGTEVIKLARSWDAPSDHVPIITEFK